MVQRFKQASSFRKSLFFILGSGVLGLIALQIFPAGKFASSLEREANPPITNSIEWGSAEAEAIARKACYDCHSNETIWPWYSKIAPVSWLVTHDINNGRAALNFSEYDPSSVHVEDLREHIYEDMPPQTYLPLHPEAELTDKEREILIAAVAETLSESLPHNMQDMEIDVDQTPEPE